MDKAFLASASHIFPWKAYAEGLFNWELEGGKVKGFYQPHLKPVDYR
jgi:hypothetical protein